MSYKIKYPNNCDTDEKKILYLIKLQEKCRLKHNIEGKKYREGKKNKKDWKDFKNDFMKRQEAITIERIKHEKNIKKEQDIDVDYDKSFMKG